MPTYEYRCSACKKDSEIEHKITAPAETRCPKCGKEHLVRLISATAPPQLQGSGWYRDGYASK
jgi:putative FmdB family regulatory protein